MTYNKKRPYDFTDGMPRYQEGDNLWRAFDYEPQTNKEGEHINSGNDPLTGEALNDWKGEYYVTKNKKRVYYKASDKVLKDIKAGKYKTGANINYYWKEKDYTK